MGYLENKQKLEEAIKEYKKEFSLK